MAKRPRVAPRPMFYTQNPDATRAGYEQSMGRMDIPVWQPTPRRSTVNEPAVLGNMVKQAFTSQPYRSQLGKVLWDASQEAIQAERDRWRKDPTAPLTFYPRLAWNLLEPVTNLENVAYDIGDIVNYGPDKTSLSNLALHGAMLVTDANIIRHAARPTLRAAEKLGTTAAGKLGRY